MGFDLSLLFFIGLAFILIGIAILFLPNVKEKQPFTQEDRIEQENKKKKLGLWWVTLQKYQTQVITGMLAFLLILLTGNTILNTPVSSSQSSSSGNTSQSSSSGSSSSSSASSSISVYEGNSLPDWDLSNPSVNQVETDQGVPYDELYFRRFQGDYYYQSGYNYMDLGQGVEPEYRLMESTFSVYNIRTQEAVFVYTFDLSDTLIDTMQADPNGTTNAANIQSVGYDGVDTVFIWVYFRPLLLSDNISSKVDGDYAPMLTYMQNKDEDYDLERTHGFLLSFSVSAPETYTIHDGYDVETPHTLFVYDLLVDTNTVYLSTNTYISSILTPPFQDRFRSDLVEYPTDLGSIGIEEDHADGFNYGVSYIHRLSFTTPTSLTFVDSSLIGINTLTYVYFSSYQDGLETRYFNDENQILLNVSLYAQQQEGITPVTDPLADFQTNFLGDQETTLLDDLSTELENHAATINETLEGIPLISLIGVIEGFYDFTANTLSDAFGYGLALYADFNAMIRYDLRTTITRYRDQEGNELLLKSVVYSRYTFSRETITYFSIESSVLSVDDVTNETTVVFLYENEVGYLTNLYTTETGFYLIGNTNLDVNSDAFLIETNLDFEVTEQLVLAGSGEDISASIGFNQEGQPTWFVLSDSIDEDFLPFATSNPTAATVLYGITF